MIDYKVVTVVISDYEFERGQKRFRTKILENLVQGWRLQGGVNVTKVSKGDMLYAQTMIKKLMETKVE